MWGERTSNGAREGVNTLRGTQIGWFPRSPGRGQRWLFLLRAFLGPKVWGCLQLSCLLLEAPGPAHPCTPAEPIRAGRAQFQPGLCRTPACPANCESSLAACAPPVGEFHCEVNAALPSLPLPAPCLWEIAPKAPHARCQTTSICEAPTRPVSPSITVTNSRAHQVHRVPGGGDYPEDPHQGAGSGAWGSTVARAQRAAGVSVPTSWVGAWLRGVQSLP